MEEDVFRDKIKRREIPQVVKLPEAICFLKRCYLNASWKELALTLPILNYENIKFSVAMTTPY